MSARCRICSQSLMSAHYAASAPSITSMSTSIDVPLNGFVCDGCGHAQTGEIPDLARYYDTDYKISLQSDDHDQLYEIVDGREVFRTEKQAELVLNLAGITSGARVLDYGAGKAATLRRFIDNMPDIKPYVFDVSQDYLAHWSRWLPPEQTATYELPPAWNEHFDVVMAHFVLEHVAEPLHCLGDLRRILKEGGRIFLSVPNALGNSGDLLVADHINHFSQSSLRFALQTTGFEHIEIHEDKFRGAFVVVAVAGQPITVSSATMSDSAAYASAFRHHCEFWTKATEVLDRTAPELANQKCAIYGAGFYGTFIATRLGAPASITCFVDRNPHVQAQKHLGYQVVPPAELPPDVEVVIAGLNPAISREVLSSVPEWQGRNIRIVYLD